MKLDLSNIDFDIDMNKIMVGAPAPDFSGVFQDPLTPEQIKQLGGLANQLLANFLTSDQFRDLGTDVNDPSKVVAAFQKYLAEDTGAQETLAQIKAIAGEGVAERLQKALADYMQNSFAPYLKQAMQQVMDQMSQQIGNAIASQLQSSLAGIMGQAAQSMGSQLANGMQNAFRVDAGAFANAIHFNMTADDLTSLMTSYANAGRLTYDNNLSTLGYADESNPQMVKIYPVDFEAKSRVVASIDAYNEAVKAAGDEDRVISYTDYMGVIMGSVTDIVNMISLVLIAFVSISLVVSSIMIGIITYISVLERKKEIGILRAMGASKGNVANVFNAETFIEGLIAGVFAIAVVLIVSVPVNAWVLREHNVANIMSLPAGAAVALICISVLLTVVAGLIPSFSAAKRDPVEALRSE